MIFYHCPIIVRSLPGSLGYELGLGMGGRRIGFGAVEGVGGRGGEGDAGSSSCRSGGKGMSCGSLGLDAGAAPPGRLTEARGGKGASSEGPPWFGLFSVAGFVGGNRIVPEFGTGCRAGYAGAAWPGRASGRGEGGIVIDGAGPPAAERRATWGADFP